TVPLHQVAPLWSPEPSADDDTADEPGAGSDDGEADGTDTSTDDTTADGDDDTPFDPVLGLAGVLIGLQPAVDDGRLVWVPPAWVGATLRRA
ncbi:MAG TPA: hypothetical protein VK866_02645, partial [Acidimicrobiales bacterium]|nr:hypothetical protein [Acidimicrobiales bacterium]